jgi:hypothetical protein
LPQVSKNEHFKVEEISECEELSGSKQEDEICECEELSQVEQEEDEIEEISEYQEQTSIE